MLRFLFFLLSIAFCVNSYSEPTPLVRMLMDTPASMFDLGMLRVQKYLDSRQEFKGYYVSFEWDKNRFLIHTTLTDDNLCRTENDCKNFLRKRIERDFKSFCFPADKECRIWSIVSEFSHIGYTTKNFYEDKSDNDAVKELRHIFLLRIDIIKEFAGKDKIISCEKSLSGSETFCTDPKNLD